MKIVIDIPESVYETYKYWHSKEIATIEQSLIAEGTVLPKGHGRLIDADEHIEKVWHSWCGSRELYIDLVKDAPTIIEADKEADDE